MALREVAAPRFAADDQVAPATDKVRVLLALEQQLFSEVLKVALVEPGGYDVVATCASLIDLPSYAARYQPDVILMDVDSERCDGLSVLRRCRAAHPAAAVLVLSGSSSPELLSDSMAEGAAGYLSLESDMHDVIAAVATAAQGQVVLSGHRLEALVRHLAQRATPVAPGGPGGKLTEREIEVLQLLVTGASTAAIAKGLFISMHTARTHVQNVLVKLGVHSRLEAAAYAVRHGLVPS